MSKDDVEPQHGSAKGGQSDDAGPAVTEVRDVTDDEKREWSAARCLLWLQCEHPPASRKEEGARRDGLKRAQTCARACVHVHAPAAGTQFRLYETPKQ